MGRRARQRCGSPPERRTYRAASAAPAPAASAAPPTSAAAFAVGRNTLSPTRSQKHRTLVKETAYSESTVHRRKHPSVSPFAETIFPELAKSSRKHIPTRVLDAVAEVLRTLALKSRSLESGERAACHQTYNHPRPPVGSLKPPPAPSKTSQPPSVACQPTASSVFLSLCFPSAFGVKINYCIVD